MTADAHLAAEFYGSARGAVTARVLRERLSAMWPDLRGPVGAWDRLLDALFAAVA